MIRRPPGSTRTDTLYPYTTLFRSFGSVAIFTDHLYPADGIAMVGSTEASWTRADWLGLIERYPRIALNLIAIVGRRLAELQDRVREMATQRPERRIAYTLLRLARQVGRATGPGTEIAIGREHH